MSIPASMPYGKRRTLQRLLASLSQVPHLSAVVLGGSYASGTQHRDSDVDIGLYYHQAAPFSVTDIRSVANSIARAGCVPTVTDFYEWGPWVNGGAWIETETGKLDFLYRNLDQIQNTIRDAHEGLVQHDYDQQPTMGFYSIAYLAETQICIALYDPCSEIARLKQQVVAYPAKLKQRTVVDSLWGAEFTLHAAKGFAATADTYNTTGCLVRTSAYLTQALFALNEKYFLSDKRVMTTVAAFPVLPIGYVERITTVLSRPGVSAAELKESVARLEDTWQSVVLLAGDMYQPRLVI